MCKVFSRAEGEGKYCTRVQCLAILTANPCNERFIIHFFDHWRLTTINQTQLQHTSEQSERPLLICTYRISLTESPLHEKTWLLVYSTLQLYYDVYGKHIVTHGVLEKTTPRGRPAYNYIGMAKYTPCTMQTISSV